MSALNFFAYKINIFSVILDAEHKKIMLKNRTTYQFFTNPFFMFIYLLMMKYADVNLAHMQIAFKQC